MKTIQRPKTKTSSLTIRLPPKLKFGLELVCRNAASVCRAFETSRRRDVLSFTHHRECAGLPTEEWEGPAYQTCNVAAIVCRKFEPIRRRINLSFTHHAECAALPTEEAA